MQKCNLTAARWSINASAGMNKDLRNWYILTPTVDGLPSQLMSRLTSVPFPRDAPLILPAANVYAV